MYERFQEGLNVIKISYKLFLISGLFGNGAIIRFHDETERVHSFIGGVCEPGTNSEFNGSRGQK